MKKSFSSTLVLAAVFGVALGWYLLWEKKFRPEKEKKVESAKELLQFDPKDLQEIVVQRQKLPAPGSKEAKGLAVSYETLKFKRLNDRWSMVEPLSDPGDDSAIQNLATTATTTKYDTIVKENVEDWKPYGLQDPKMKISIFKNSNTKEELWVGDDTPVGYATYVRKPGTNTLYQTSRALRTAYERKVDDLREKKVLNWVRADVDEVEIRGSHGEVLVKHTADDKWTLPRQDVPVDDTEWNKTLNAVLELRASEFASDTAKDLAPYGLSKPSVTVNLKKTGSQEHLIVSLGKVKDKYYAKRSDRPTIFVVTKDALDKSDPAANTLMDRSVAKFNRFQVKKILIEHTGAVVKGEKKDSVELVKSAADWTIPAEPSAKVAFTKVDGLITALQDMKLTDYVATPPKNPGLRIVLYEEKTHEGKTSEVEAATLGFAAGDAQTVLGGRTGFSKGFKLKQSDFKNIYLGKTDFIETKKEATSEEAKKASEKKPNS